MKIAQYDGEVVGAEPKAHPSLGSDVFASILDKDYDSIESDFFGSRAIDCLSLTSESAAAPPQGSPFLRFAQPISAILRRYKGVYSI